MERFAIILAGGKGERLWPLTLNKPKCLLRLWDRETLLESTLKRVDFLKDKRIVVCNKEYSGEIIKICQRFKIPVKNILIEEESRNTLPASLFALFRLREKYQDFLFSLLPSDHLISPVDIFRKELNLGFESAKREKGIVLLGIRPQKKDRSFGYIDVGSRKRMLTDKKVFKVERFIEKPPLEILERIFSQRKILWNSGIFISTAGVFLKEAKRHLKRLFLEFEEAYEKRNLNLFYKKLISLQIDKCLLEKVKNIFVIPAHFEWSDIGNFYLLDRFLKKDKSLNFFKAKCLDRASCNTTVICEDDDIIITLGLKNLIVVKSGKNILVASKKETPILKDVLTNLRRIKFHRSRWSR